MQRTVSTSMEVKLDGLSDLIVSIAVSTASEISAESLSFTLDGEAQQYTEIVDRLGSRIQRFTSGPGLLTVEYRAVVEGIAAPPIIDELDLITYLRPSRYCESDSLLPTARSEFAGLRGHALLTAVTEWVGGKLAYVPGSSLVTDGAARTLMARAGVCRDYAHLVIALLRALDVPARMAAVYAPGLSPMDFHAVAEAFVDGEWWVVDATGLAPRQSMLRISTGRDAADIAFLTNHGADLTLRTLTVMAVVDELPTDDGVTLRQLR
jgi:transglutaminase-like putative cysteine protease